MLSRWASFAAVRPVEHDPGRKVVAEILEAMRLASRGKQQIAGGHWYEPFAIEELTVTPGNDVDLILCVWGLRIMPARRVHFYRECAVAEQLDGTCVGPGGYCRESSFEGNFSRSHADEY
jgi:hypothetical protein